MERLVNPDPEFWRGKRVLLTGHTGFKGAWLNLWLTHMGAQVLGFSLAPETEPNLSVLTSLSDGLHSIIGDIRDKATLERVFEEFSPEIVLHLAAQALVRQSYTDPIQSFSTNVIGTLNVLEAASSCRSVRCTLVVTTDKCYENREWLWAYREDEALGGHDPYSASKACTEIATSAWRSSLRDMKQFDRNNAPLYIATARAGNVFGGGDWAADRLVPDFFRATFAGDELVIRNPSARRPWQHVLEPLSGYLLLAETLWDGKSEEAWNFGPSLDDIQPVSFILEHLFGENAEKPGKGWRLAEGSQPHEASFLALDASKARFELGWRPRIPLSVGLAWTSEWYNRHHSGESARALTLEQISRFVELALPLADRSVTA